MTLKIDYQAPEKLVPCSHNPKTHSQGQITQIAASIKQFGFTNPILVNKDNMIIAGHGRHTAALKLGMTSVPTIECGHLSKDEMRTLIIADNKIAENAGWDPEILAIEFQYLSSIDLDFDLEITGFETAEIDIIIDNIDYTNQDPLDKPIEPEMDKAAVTQEGDLIQLGNHKLYCGDSLSFNSYDFLLDGEKANMVFTDPPYNVPIDGHVCGNGDVKHDDFAMASGEMTTEEFTDFLSTSLDQMRPHLTEGVILYVCMDWRHTCEIDQAIRNTKYTHKNTCVWVKNNGGMGSLYRSQHEFIYVLKYGTKPHINNIELGKHGRYRTNIWQYAGVNTFRKGRMDELTMHPTVKPVAMVIDAIKDCSKRKHIILDPFAGSGTTLIAAEKSGRYARLIEIDPHYCDAIVERWEKLTDEKAIRTRR